MLEQGKKLAGAIHAARRLQQAQRIENLAFVGAVQRIHEQAQGLRIGHVTLDLRQIDFASRQLLAERIHVRFAQCQADAHGGHRQKNRRRGRAAEIIEGQYDERGDRPA